MSLLEAKQGKALRPNFERFAVKQGSLSTSMIMWTLASEHIPRCSCEAIGSGLGSGIFCLCYLQASSVAAQPVRMLSTICSPPSPWERHHIPHIAHPGEIGHQSVKPHAKAPVRTTAISSQICIPFQVAKIFSWLEKGVV